MTLIMKSCVTALVILLLWQAEEGAEAAGICFCPLMKPPLEVLCDSEVVIRARVTGHFFGSLKYDIKAIQVYKGPDGNIDAVYSTFWCRVSLDTDKDYLITGGLEADGTVQISGCGFIRLWEDLTADELKLLQNYDNSCSK